MRDACRRIESYLHLDSYLWRLHLLHHAFSFSAVPSVTPILVFPDEAVTVPPQWQRSVFLTIKRSFSTPLILLSISKGVTVTLTFLPIARQGNVFVGICQSFCSQSASWLLGHCSSLLQCSQWASYWNAFLLFR